MNGRKLVSKRHALEFSNQYVEFTNFLRNCTTESAQCENYGNLLSLFFGKNFVKVTILLTKLLNS